jgi:hypothetical protein
MLPEDAHHRQRQNNVPDVVGPANDDSARSHSCAASFSAVAAAIFGQQHEELRAVPLQLRRPHPEHLE